MVDLRRSDATHSERQRDTAGHSTKEASALLREARSLLRRADTLFAASSTVEDLATSGLPTEAGRAVEQLVHHLTRLEHQRQRRARDAVRRNRQVCGERRAVKRFALLRVTDAGFHAQPRRCELSQALGAVDFRVR